ncbi:hypothetical protein V3851_08395 [Paenibacillus sp. M1]|uniref:Uncharacterized protein n=1 Tax=Paenibacillus haidiansis TaxID=1574488 RepID=A0ABU7VQ10_9BACL
MGPLSNKAKYNILSILFIFIVVISWFMNIGWIRVFLAIPMIFHAIIFYFSNSFYHHNNYKNSKFMKVVNISFYCTYLLCNILLPDGGDVGDPVVFFGLINNKKLTDAAGIAAGLCLFANVVLMIVQILYTITIKERLKDESTQNREGAI